MPDAHKSQYVFELHEQFVYALSREQNFPKSEKGIFSPFVV